MQFAQKNGHDTKNYKYAIYGLVGTGSRLVQVPIKEEIERRIYASPEELHERMSELKIYLTSEDWNSRGIIGMAPAIFNDPEDKIREAPIHEGDQFI